MKESRQGKELLHVPLFVHTCTFSILLGSAYSVSHLSFDELCRILVHKSKTLVTKGGRRAEFETLGHLEFPGTCQQRGVAGLMQPCLTIYQHATCEAVCCSADVQLFAHIMRIKGVRC